MQRVAVIRERPGRDSIPALAGEAEQVDRLYPHSASMPETEAVRSRTPVSTRVLPPLPKTVSPDVSCAFAWYIHNYGPEVNLFVDNSQIVQLECRRSGIWGTAGLWGRVLTYKG